MHSIAESLQESLSHIGDLSQAIVAVSKVYGIGRQEVEAIACEMGYVPDKYYRNIGTMGEKGQARLLRSKVVLIGLGGLGGYVLEQLARMGVGSIVGVDPDRFEATNLNRQLLANANSLGKYKTDVARERMLSINDALDFKTYTCHVEQLTSEIYQGCDLMFDCLDNIASRLFLEQQMDHWRIPLVHGAIGGWYAQMAVLAPGSRLLTMVYSGHREGIEQKLGNPPFAPTFTAGWMVAEGIKLLLGLTTPQNTLYCFDLLENQFHRFAIAK